MILYCIIRPFGDLWDGILLKQNNTIFLIYLLLTQILSFNIVWKYGFMDRFNDRKVLTCVIITERLAQKRNVKTARYHTVNVKRISGSASKNLSLKHWCEKRSKRF